MAKPSGPHRAAQRREQLGEVARVGALRADLLEAERGRVEHVARGAGRVAARRVGAVARERVAQMRERRAHLVQEAGHRAHLEQRRTAQRARARASA